MNNSKDEIYEAAYSGISTTANFQVVRDFIVARAHNTEKEILPRLYEQYAMKLTNDDFKKAFKEYFDESQKKNSVSVLVKHMQKFYLINNTDLTKSVEFAKKLSTNEGFANHIRLESRALLSGDRNYSTLVAAQEAEEIMERLVASQKEVQVLKVQVTSLSDRLNTLVSNLKSVLGLGDEKIKELSEKQEEKEKQTRGLKL